MVILLFFVCFCFSFCPLFPIAAAERMDRLIRPASLVHKAEGLQADAARPIKAAVARGNIITEGIGLQALSYIVNCFFFFFYARI